MSSWATALLGSFGSAGVGARTALGDVAAEFVFLSLDMKLPRESIDANDLRL
jgi:hypothetical protein